MYKIDGQVMAVEVVVLLGGAMLPSSAFAVVTQLPEAATRHLGGGS